MRCELQKTYITNRSKAKKLRNLQRASYFAREAVVEEEMIRSVRSLTWQTNALEDVKKHCERLGVEFPVTEQMVDEAGATGS